MIAKDCGLKVGGAAVALALLSGFDGAPALAQLSALKGRGTAAPAAAPAATPTPAAASAGARGTAPQLKLTAIPVNPSDPIAIINGEVITRSQLADECVARKGEEILETLVARKLIEQALRGKKIEVTASEIDQEIENVAQRVAGIGREAWLRTLDKERGISPIQYARDIIYPALALRKLAGPRVQVTETDMQDSFEAQYGDKIRCRMIMVDKLHTATEIWEELRKNPGGFEKLAMERSMDSGSRSIGGLLTEPISRHAYPRTVSDAAFQQLVDGDPKDKDPSHKPKDGDFTGPIQVAEATWVILRRESVIPAQGIDRNNPAVKKQVYDMIYEVKLKEAMGAYMIELMQQASIDNKLTGKVKLANEQVDLDQEVKLMGGRPNATNTNTATTRPAATPSNSGNAARLKTPPPAALSPDVVKQTEKLTAPTTKK
ncbi:MAG: parvulin peptidyl-prolyl isomerase [Isosphaeraceae bacterium]